MTAALVSQTQILIDNKEVTRTVTADPAVEALIAKYNTIAAPLANRVIGSITANITRTANAAGESALGDVIADGQLEATDDPGFGDAVVAFMNPGGIRADLTFARSPAGEGDSNVTYGEMFTVQPFGNSLVTLTLTGAQIERLLEEQFAGCTLATARVLQVSAGFTYTWSAGGPVCDKVNPATIMINGVVVDPVASYRVTVNSFLADGGDSFPILIQGSRSAGRCGGHRRIRGIFPGPFPGSSRPDEPDHRHPVVIATRARAGEPGLGAKLRSAPVTTSGAPSTSGSRLVESAIRFVTTALQAQADPEKAVGMQAYMKTDMPFYGVQKPARVPIARRLVAEFAPQTREQYQDLVLGLWGLPHREEKYLALEVAERHPRFVDTASLPLYRRLIVDGAWWDFVDEVATHLVRTLVLDEPERAWAEVDTWIEAEDVWLRRSAIICQIGAKDQTDARRLFSFCTAQLDQKEFFIRKAIGWSLREYAKTDPDAVARFVATHRDELSPLSFREATKHIGHLVS